MQIPKVPRRISPPRLSEDMLEGMTLGTEDGALFIVVYTFGNSNFLHQTSIAILLQVYTDESNRGRIMSLFGLINRGLGPIGSFPFGPVATWIGAPLTVGICGFLTISLAAAVVHWRPYLRNAKWIDQT